LKGEAAVAAGVHRLREDAATGAPLVAVSRHDASAALAAFTNNMQHFAPLDKPTLAGSTLLLPLVSLGNVPQLTADLILASLEMRCIGVFAAHCHVPIVAARDDDAALPFLTPVEGPAPSRALCTLTLEDSISNARWRLDNAAPALSTRQGSQAGLRRQPAGFHPGGPLQGRFCARIHGRFHAPRSRLEAQVGSFGCCKTSPKTFVAKHLSGICRLRAGPSPNSCKSGVLLICTRRPQLRKTYRSFRVAALHDRFSSLPKPARCRCRRCSCL
jgi:hypothetical protein